jgi:hypothetical protein
MHMQICMQIQRVSLTFQTEVQCRYQKVSESLLVKKESSGLANPLILKYILSCLSF